MFKSHFGFQTCPFAAAPNPEAFVENDNLHKILTDMRFCVESGQGIAVVTGDAGVGKTMICQKLAYDLSDEFTIVTLPNTNYSNRTALLQSILFELGRKYVRLSEQELRLELVSALRGLCMQGDYVILLADEAECLNADLLSELRSLSSLSMLGKPLMRLVLSGQMPLEECLLQPSMAALNQRIRCQTWVPQMTSAESVDYIAAQCRVAGRSMNDVMTEDAVSLIVKASDGNPRCINQLCDHSLRMAFMNGEQAVSFASAREALDEMVQLPLQWNDPAADSISMTDSEDFSEVESAVATDSVESTSSYSEDGDTAVFEVGAAEVNATDSVAPYMPEDVVVDEADFESFEPTQLNDDSPVLTDDSKFVGDYDDASLPVVATVADSEPAEVDENEDYDDAAYEDEDYPTADVEPESTDDIAAEDDVVVGEEYDSADASVGMEETVEVDEDGFHEEVVYDRYACIDAGRSHFIVDNDSVLDRISDELCDDVAPTEQYVVAEDEIDTIGFADEVEVDSDTIAVASTNHDDYRTESLTEEVVEVDEDEDELVSDVPMDDPVSIGVYVSDDCVETDDCLPETMETVNSADSTDDFLPVTDTVETPDTLPLVSETADEQPVPTLGMNDDAADSDEQPMEDSDEPIVAVIPNNELYDIVEPPHAGDDDVRNRAYSNLFSRLKRLQERQQRADAS